MTLFSSLLPSAALENSTLKGDDLPRGTVSGHVRSTKGRQTQSSLFFLFREEEINVLSGGLGSGSVSKGVVFDEHKDLSLDSRD